MNSVPLFLFSSTPRPIDPQGKLQAEAQDYPGLLYRGFRNAP